MVRHLGWVPRTTTNKRENFVVGLCVDDRRRPAPAIVVSPLTDAAYGVDHLYDVRRRRLMADPIEDIIGDYRAFAAQQRDRLAARGIDIAPYALSHLAYRVPEWDQYVHVRRLLERHAVANRENVWNGRPISLIVPAEPLEVLDGKLVPLIELIPPVHQRVYKMGLEHLGVVVGDTFDAFVGAHKPVLTGQQFQGPNSTPDPVYILFEDFTHVKFYRLSLQGIRRARCWPVRRRVPSRRRLGAPAACDRARPEPSAAMTDFHEEGECPQGGFEPLIHRQPTSLVPIPNGSSTRIRSGRDHPGTGRLGRGRQTVRR